jgi:hypothetical protein
MSPLDKMASEHLDKMLADDNACNHEFGYLIWRDSQQLIRPLLLALVPFILYAVVQMFRYGLYGADYLDVIYVCVWVLIYKLLQFREINLRAFQRSVPWWLRLRYWTDYCWASFAFLGIVRPAVSLQIGITFFRVLTGVAFFLLSAYGFNANRRLNRLESIVRTAEKHPESKRDFLRVYWQPLKKHYDELADTPIDADG